MWLTNVFCCHGNDCGGLNKCAKSLSYVRLISQCTVVLCIIGMDEVLAHYACTFKNSNLHFHFQS